MSKTNAEKDDPQQLIVICGVAPEGTTHRDTGPSQNKWVKVGSYTHDYWCDQYQVWVAFEQGLGLNKYNAIRQHWLPV